MNEMHDVKDSQADDLTRYYEAAETWSADRDRALQVSRKLAWIIAGVATLVALLEAFALIALAPLKTVVPYTLLVDRRTGNVQTLKPLGQQDITPDDALVRSFLAQYVTARETFDISSLNDNYRKVALWSADEARARYLSAMDAANPLSPFKTMPRQTLVEVEVRSLSALAPDTALVRFATFRTDPGGQRREVGNWAAVLRYRFSAAQMSEADRLLNPLGFQVLRYRRDAEVPPLEASASAQAQPQAPAPTAGAQAGGLQMAAPGQAVLPQAAPGLRPAPRSVQPRPAP